LNLSLQVFTFFGADWSGRSFFGTSLDVCLDLFFHAFTGIRRICLLVSWPSFGGSLRHIALNLIPDISSINRGFFCCVPFLLGLGTLGSRLFGSWWGLLCISTTLTSRCAWFGS
jgi:hypothetical protein